MQDGFLSGWPYRLPQVRSGDPCQQARIKSIWWREFSFCKKRIIIIFAADINLKREISASHTLRKPNTEFFAIGRTLCSFLP